MRHSMDGAARKRVGSGVDPDPTLPPVDTQRLPPSEPTFLPRLDTQRSFPERRPWTLNARLHHGVSVIGHPSIASA